MIKFSCLICLWFISLAYGASKSEIQALIDLYNSCNGPSWTTHENWSITGQSDPCGPSPWAGVSCDGNPQYISIVKLYYNNLQGQIPDSIANLESLTVLDLSLNDLKGTIPEGIYSVATLNQLQLNLNNLSGTISNSVGNLKALKILALGQNSMTGTIPESLYTISTLEQMEFTGNHLTGTFSNSISNLPNLQLLLAGANKFTGTIPSGIGNLTRLSMLQFTTNIITGTIPQSLCSLYSLTGLWLDNNKVGGGGLTGSIPPCLGNLTSLLNFFVSGNKLTGGIPFELSQLKNVQQLFLGDNSLGGTIPEQLGQIGTTLTHLDISQSAMTGSIPGELGSLTGLQYLNLATNQLTGTIPNSITNLVNLQQLLLQATYMSSNTLMGTIPAGIFSLEQLNLLMLANNKFNGSLPYSFSLSKLQTLDLTRTQLGGFLPEQLFANINLTFLYLSSNKFEGTLGSITMLTKLQQLTLDNNQFSGYIPPFFNNTTFGNPPKSVLSKNPFLCPLPSWAAAYTGATCIDWIITNLSPPYADTFFSTPIVVNGSKFQNLSELACNFGSITPPSPVTFINGSQLMCTAPTTSNVSRVLNFTLTYQGNPFGVTNVPSFVYLGIPKIESIYPDSGREQGFVTVTVTGSNFYSSPGYSLVSCLFGSTFVPASTVNYTQVVCVTPPNTPGDVAISVSIDGNHTIGNADIIFTYFEYCDGLPQACLGNGVCNTAVSPPVCICNTNFRGDICGECDDLFFGPQCLACPECGTNGTCNDTIVGNGLCVCEAGFYGTNCKACPLCVNGKCLDGQRGSGKCHCNTLWAGKLCDSRWILYVIVAVPVAVIVVIVVGVVVKIRASKREYKRLSRAPQEEVSTN